MLNPTISLTGFTGNNINIIYLENTSIASVGLEIKDSNNIKTIYKLLAYGKMAMFIKKHLNQGDKIAVEGTVVEGTNGKEVVLEYISLVS